MGLGGRSKPFTADPSDKVGFAAFVTRGRVGDQKVVEKIHENTHKEFGTNVSLPQ
jgi:hypothetical protein